MIYIYISLTKSRHVASRSQRILKSLGGCCRCRVILIFFSQTQGLIHFFFRRPSIWSLADLAALRQQRYSTGYVSCFSYTSRCHAVLFVRVRMILLFVKFVDALWLIESTSSLARHQLWCQFLPTPHVIVMICVNPSKPHGLHLLESISKAYCGCFQW